MNKKSFLEKKKWLLGFRIMYKYKNKKESSFCPMGEFDNGFVECYWFGTVSLSDCRECNVRKDNTLITKFNRLL